ncbi:MAG: transposase family protein [Planctomycetaceae bacterium]
MCAGGTGETCTTAFCKCDRPATGHNHDLLEMVFMALTATICGADGWVDVERFAKSKRDWFRQYRAAARRAVA